MSAPTIKIATPETPELFCDGCEQGFAAVIEEIVDSTPMRWCPECFEQATREAMVEECAAYLEKIATDLDARGYAAMTMAASALREADL